MKAVESIQTKVESVNPIVEETKAVSRKEKSIDGNNQLIPVHNIANKKKLMKLIILI
jgi:hypothetical protein